MQLQITLDRDSTAEDAARAIRTIQAAYPAEPIARPKPAIFADAVADTAANVDDEHAYAAVDSDPNAAIGAPTGIFTASELAADAVPPPPAYPASVEIDPATIGFGVIASATQGGSNVPTLPLPPTTPPAGVTVPLDSAGLPHDPRIHASTKTKIQNGEWKRKPKVEQADYDRIVAELRAVMAIPNVTIKESLGGHTVIMAGAVPVPPAPAPPPVAPATPGEPSTFPEFIAWVSPIVSAGKLSVLDVNAAALELGLVNGSGAGSIQLLANRPDLVPQAFAKLSAKVSQ